MFPIATGEWGHGEEEEGHIGQQRIKAKSCTINESSAAADIAVVAPPMDESSAIAAVAPPIDHHCGGRGMESYAMMGDAIAGDAARFSLGGVHQAAASLSEQGNAGGAARFSLGGVHQAVASLLEQGTAGGAARFSSGGICHAAALLLEQGTAREFHRPTEESVTTASML